MSQQFINPPGENQNWLAEQPPKRRHWPWIVAAFVVAAVIFAVGMVAGHDVGYRAGEQDATDAIKAAAADTAPGRTPDVEEPSEEPLAEPADEDPEKPADEPVEPPVPDYGNFTDNNVFVWEDGLEVAVSKLEEFTPSDVAAYDESPAYVRFTVTIQNNTGSEFDPTGFYDTMQSGGVEATSVFDEGLEGSPSTTLLDGRKVSFNVGYGVADPTDLVLEIAPSFDHDPAIFTTDAS